MSATDHQVQELLPAYALGILSQEDARMVQRHLETCHSCRQELREYEEVGAELALAVPEVAPPPALEQRLMAGIRTEPAHPPGWIERLWARLETIGQQLRFERAWAAASLLLLFLLMFLLWRSGLEREPFASFPTVALAGTEAAPAASGMVVSSDDGLHGTLIVQHLPWLDEEEQTYQLWLIREGAWEDGGTFTVDEDGYDAHYPDASEHLTSYDAFAVTIEPAGGSSTPAGPRVLTGER
jgi:anti-sigma-K factor RskA